MVLTAWPCSGTLSFCEWVKREKIWKLLQPMYPIRSCGELTFDFDGQRDAGSLLHRAVVEPLQEARRNQRLLGVWRE